MNGVNPNAMVAGVAFVLWVGVFLYLLRLESLIKGLNREKD
jgi:hypothetical protein